jgi:hypothetical protein
MTAAVAVPRDRAAARLQWLPPAWLAAVLLAVSQENALTSQDSSQCRLMAGRRQAAPGEHEPACIFAALHPAFHLSYH